MTLLPIDKTLLKRTALVLALASACAGASAAALPQFTLNPAGTTPALNGSSFTADNLLVSDYSTVTFASGTFTDTGFLSISAAQLAGSTFTPAGLNTDYGLYIAFTGSGTTVGTDPTTAPTIGTFTSLNYTLYGYNGTATFDFSGNTPTTSAMNPVALASGSLIRGSAVTIPNGDGTFTPSGSAKLSMSTSSTGFFSAPAPFYNLGLTAFANTSSQVEAFAGGFRIRQGGGSINFASAVPEPGSYAMLLAGMGVIGFVARRRRPRSMA